MLKLNNLSATQAEIVNPAKQTETGQLRGNRRGNIARRRYGRVGPLVLND